MANQLLIITYLVLIFAAANVAWVRDKAIFNTLSLSFPNGSRWLEWFLLYVVSVGLGLLLELKLLGTLSEQSWEFYVVTLCLFVVFALPGFIYCYDLKKILKRR
ncbi:MAG: hypothetical protein A6F71_03585 [Cycloclasticus sp. symbiont of Poecilosclerida sp. M]|nr:MAG: hypothetical protein A6F71_03585 [Cycloclasticus sp. symbiont of Poecilosclerida sp. M]